MTEPPPAQQPPRHQRRIRRRAEGERHASHGQRTSRVEDRARREAVRNCSARKVKDRAGKREARGDDAQGDEREPELGAELAQDRQHGAVGERPRHNDRQDGHDIGGEP